MPLGDPPGSTPRGGVPAVLLLHGQPGRGTDWAEVADGLRRRRPDLPVRAPDRPGYDGRPAGGFFYNAELLSAADPLGTAARPRGTVVVGYSWAAGVALALAVTRPAAVAGLVLVAPVGSPLAVTRLDRWLARPLPGAGTAAVLPAVSRWAPRLLARSVGSRLPPERRARAGAELRGRDLRAAWRSWAAEQRALVAETGSADAPLTGRLAEVRAPVVLLAGDRDTAVPPAAVTDLADRLVNAPARVDRLTGGHLLLAERPAAVAAAVLAAVEAAARPAAGGRPPPA